MGCRGRGRFPFPCISLCSQPLLGQRRQIRVPSVKTRYGKLGKVDGVTVFIHRQQANPFSPTELHSQTHRDFFQLNSPLCCTLRTSIVTGYSGSGSALGNLRGDTRIHRRRRLHCQAFMRTHLVVLLAKPVHHPLLLPPIGGRRHRCLLLQRAMHPLVPPVLLRMPGFNPLRHDPQLHPPHRQPRQSRYAPVDANGAPLSVRIASGMPYSRKHRFKDRLHSRRVHLLHRLAAQQIPAVRIRDGQRIDPLSIPGAKPAFEIRAPYPVRSIRMRQWFRVRPASCTVSVAQPSALHRFSSAPIVLAAGHTRPGSSRSSTRFNFRGPHLLCASRKSNTICSISSGVWFSCRCVARLFSRSPSNPTA